jgi:putative transposase
MASRTAAEWDTIWEVPDELWERIELILLEHFPPKGTGRPAADWRGILNGIIFRLRTGCQWNKLPKQFGDDSTVHRWFQKWNQCGVMQQIWRELVQECEVLEGVHWEWQAADGAMAKARFGGTKSAPIPRIEPKTVRSAASSSTSKAVRWPR